VNRDVTGLAYLTIIGICLVLVGAILTAGVLSIAERGTVLGAIFAALAFVGWRWQRHSRGGDE